MDVIYIVQICEDDDVQQVICKNMQMLNKLTWARKHIICMQFHNLLSTTNLQTQINQL